MVILLVMWRLFRDSAGLVEGVVCVVNDYMKSIQTRRATGLPS